MAGSAGGNQSAEVRKKLADIYIQYFNKLQTDEARRKLLWWLDDELPVVSRLVRAGIAGEWEIRARRMP